MPTSRNARGVDVMCFSMDGQRKLLIQVKSLSTPADVPMGGDLEKIMGDYWIIVVGATCDRPTCYVLTADEAKALAGKNERADGKISCWLPRRRYAVEEFCEKWGLIGTGC